jgi:hypothetical protein
MLQSECAKLYAKRYYSEIDYQEAFEEIVCEENEDRFGYISFTFSFRSAHLKGLYTPSVGAIEKIEYSYSQLEEFEVLIAYLREYYFQKDAWHCEVFASAYIPEEQAILADLGFSVIGYAVSWRAVSHDSREDAVVFALFNQLPNKDKMDLIPEFEDYYRCIYSKPEKAQLENVEQSFIELYKNGLNRDSPRLAGYALENIAELCKIQNKYSMAILYLKEAADLYSECDAVKAKRCIQSVDRLKYFNF